MRKKVWLVILLVGVLGLVAQASVTAAEHADDAIGADMAELLSYLP